MNPGVMLKETFSVERASSIVSPSGGMENLSCKSNSVESVTNYDLEPKMKRQCVEDMPSGYKKIDDGGYVILPRQRMEEMCKKTKCSSCGACGTLAIMPENYVKQNSFITVSYISRTTSYVNDGILVICSRLDCGKIMYRYNGNNCDAPSSQKIPKLVSVGQKSSATAVPENISIAASKDKLTDPSKGVLSLISKSCTTDATTGDVSPISKVASAVVANDSVHVNSKNNKQIASQPNTIAYVTSPSSSVAFVPTNVAALSKTVVTACPQVKLMVTSALTSRILPQNTFVSVPQIITSACSNILSPQPIVQKRNLDFPQIIQNICVPDAKPQTITAALSQKGILEVAQTSNIMDGSSQGVMATLETNSATIQQNAEKSYSQKTSQSSAVTHSDFTWTHCERETTGLQKSATATLPVHTFTFQRPGTGVVPETDVFLPESIAVSDEETPNLDCKAKSVLILKSCFAPTAKSTMSESMAFDNSANDGKVFDNSGGEAKVFDNSASNDKVIDNSASKDRSHWLKTKKDIKIEKDSYSRAIAEIKVENVDVSESEETQAAESSSVKFTRKKNSFYVLTPARKQDPSIEKTETGLKGKRQRKKCFGGRAEEIGVAEKHIKIEVSDKQSVNTYLNEIVVHDGISAIKREEKEKFDSIHSSVEENESDELIVNGLSVEETIREEKILTDCFL